MYWKQLKNWEWEVKGKGGQWKGLNRTKESRLTAGILWETGWNMDVSINTKRQGYKIGTVWGEVWEGQSEWRRLRRGYMVNGLHILIWNRTKKQLLYVWQGLGQGWDGRGDLII
jgi:hypothetical protein